MPRKLKRLEDLFNDEWFRKLPWTPEETRKRLKAIRRWQKKEFVPGAVLKVVPGTIAGRKDVREFLLYLSQDGELEVELHDGSRLNFAGGHHDLNALVDEWEIDFTTRAHTRDVIHLMISTPTTLDWEKYRVLDRDVRAQVTREDGRIHWEKANELAPHILIKSDKQAIHEIVRELMPQIVPDNTWVFAVHDDQAHRHAHIAIKAIGFEGDRVSPDRAMLHAWRETYAAVAAQHGIVMDPTPRIWKGLAPKETLGTKALYEAAQIARTEGLDEVKESLRDDVSRLNGNARAFLRRLLSDHEHVDDEWDDDEKRYHAQGEQERAAYFQLAKQITEAGQWAEEQELRAATKALAMSITAFAEEMPEWIPRREQAQEKIEEMNRERQQIDTQNQEVER